MSSIENVETQEAKNVPTDAQQTLSNEAIALFQCGHGGPIVSNPQDCRDMDRASLDLPKLALGPYRDPKPLDGKLPWPKPDPRDTGILRT
ncbi:MAG: hypothetical protein IPP57_12345 [Candidatus Obscuribacter sp.]|jgi:hypothetical protein|nr:hypothetical protein [Candidatus Obscuribacter sp.]MBK9205229.1 hypothetical protein [Candidatus Obscuribacter sp.]MBK9771597.1 hypothetical protein [Candidatus Obscuribacter sp.]MBL0185094.1 hypothetical protein [Candidatus Obscuribacter sp.]MBP6348123.1 hypothetical protein [Candidatus Obscuribacter sp.]